MHDLTTIGILILALNYSIQIFLNVWIYLHRINRSNWCLDYIGCLENLPDSHVGTILANIKHFLFVNACNI